MTLFFSFSDSLKKISPGSHILITGASGSLGQALASVYAAPGIHLTLQGRNPDKLEQIAAECRQKGAFVSIKALDLLQTEQVRAWAVSLADDPPSLVIANAGLNTNIGPDAEGELYENALNLVKVNFLSVMALVYGLLPAMRRRKSGQIALMSSLAGCYGLIHTPTYCATKAALRIWGASLRGWLAPEGIQVNVIMPGYVESPMCADMPGPKPFLWQPDKAARVIRKGLERNRGRISFPFPLNLGMWALSILPLWLAMPIAKFLGYGR